MGTGARLGLEALRISPALPVPKVIRLRRTEMFNSSAQAGGTQLPTAQVR
jgi:hypothetical protein